jgi:hypothetical protein
MTVEKQKHPLLALVAYRTGQTNGIIRLALDNKK